MIASVIFEIASLLFVILMTITYYTKKFVIRTPNKIYRYLLINQLIMLFLEIASAIIFENTDSLFLIDLSNRLTWISGITFFYLLYIYSYTYINEIYYLSIKEIIKRNKEPRIFSIFSLIFFIIYFALPFKVMTIETYTYIPGIAAIAVILYSSTSIIMSFKLLVTTEGISKRSKYSLFSLLALSLVILPLQFGYQKILFIGMGTTFQLFILYFLIENPDLRLIEDIDNLKISIERSSKAKTDFLSNMSHEIRSPMNAIIGFSESIINDEDFEIDKVLNDVGHIKSSSKNLLDIINNILDISKIETGNDTIENKEYSLASHIVDWNGIVETRLANKNIKFILDVDNTIPSKLYGDSTKIFQVVLNILTNAVKYTDVGRIKMTITKDIVSNNNILLKFKVADTGFGIKEEDYGKVFQKFSRLDSAKTNEIEGTGLGLVLTKKYAELMGGNIWFESEYEAGTTFYFNVPQKIIDQTPMGNINQTLKEEGEKVLIDCSNYKALVVDDDELNLKVTQRILEEYKFNVETLSNAEETITKIKREEHFDIIFLDHIMPGIDGIKLVQALKSMKNIYTIPPIIALTANAITGMREVYLNAGFDDYLSKPIDINELDKIINKYFNKQKKEQ